MPFVWTAEQALHHGGMVDVLLDVHEAVVRSMNSEGWAAISHLCSKSRHPGVVHDYGRCWVWLGILKDDHMAKATGTTVSVKPKFRG